MNPKFMNVTNKDLLTDFITAVINASSRQTDSAVANMNEIRAEVFARMDFQTGDQLAEYFCKKEVNA